MSREERTRREILDAATALFQRYGLRKTTLDDIARSLGKRKSFLYYYYAGKDELIEAVAEREMRSIIEDSRRFVEQKDTARARVHAFFAVRLREVRDRLKLFGQTLDDLRAQGNAEIALMTRLRYSFDQAETRFLAGLIREGVKGGEFRPLSEEQLASLCFFALSAQRGVEMDLVLDPGGHDPLAHIDAAMEILLRGLEV